MAGAVYEIFLIPVFAEQAVKFFGDVGSDDSRFDAAARPFVHLPAELDQFAPPPFQFAHDDGQTDAGRIAVDLGGKIQLHDVSLFDLAVARAGNGVAGARLAEHVHGQALVLGAVFVDDALGYAHHLQFGDARLQVFDDLVGRQFDDAEPFADARQFVFALDLAKIDHDVVAGHDLRLREGVFQPLVDGQRAFDVTAEADPDIFAGNAHRFECVAEGIGVQFGIGRICRFAEFAQHEYLFQLAEISAEHRRFGADQQRRVAACADHHARALEQRPETAEIPRVRIVALRRHDQHRVQPAIAQHLCGARHPFMIFMVGNTDPLAHNKPPKALISANIIARRRKFVFAGL